MTTRRLYVDNAHDHSMLTGAVLQGLGKDTILTAWPKGRSYNDISYFRSPYTRGVFQTDNPALLGLGAPPSSIAASIDQAAPPNVKRFLLSGEPVPALANNVALPTNQVPRLGYGIIALGALALSYVSYKRFKKTAAK
jgi:hypothetical protein